MKNKYGILFKNSLFLSAFTFGGGFVIISLMKKKYVDELKWLGEDEMLDIAAMAQSTPGAVAVNASILVGYRIGKIPGMLSSVLGTIIPPFVIISIVYFFYAYLETNPFFRIVLNGLQPAIAAIVLDVVLSMTIKLKKEHDWILNLILIVSFIATYWFEIPVMTIIALASGIGLVRYGMKVVKQSCF